MSVCLYVCPLEYLKNYMPKLHDFLHMLTAAAAAAEFSCDDNAIRYVLPVLLITGRLVTPCGDECIRSPPALLCRGSEDEVAVRDLRIVFLRSNRISNRIGRPIRFRIEFSNRIGRIYHASRNTV